MRADLPNYPVFQITPRYPIYMFALRKSVKERFSEGSEAVVLLSVVLSGLPAGIVLLE